MGLQSLTQLRDFHPEVHHTSGETVPEKRSPGTASLILRCAGKAGNTFHTKIDSMLKSRGITLPTKVRLVKAMVFPVVIWM